MLPRFRGGIVDAPPGLGEDEAASAEVQAWRPEPLLGRVRLHPQDAEERRLLLTLERDRSSSYGRNT